MKTSRLFSLLPLLTGIIAVTFTAQGHAEDADAKIKFSDPSKPGTIQISSMQGDIRVTGADTAEVTVKTDAQPQAARKNGMRVLTASASYSLTEKDNVVTLDAASDGWHGKESDFRVTVPRGTAVVIRGSIVGGDIRCTNIDGDIQIKSLNGEVTLENVGGGVAVETHNGEINATIRQLREGKPLAFATQNGEIVVRVPSDAKANVRLRTQNGVVMTDFSETELVARTENSPRASSRRNFNGLPPEAREAIRHSAQIAASVGREVAQSIREGLQATEREIARERAAIDSQRSSIEREAGIPAPPVPPAPAMPALPPIPPIPTMSGGSLVTGPLNGGGPEISIQTINGDITLHHLDRKR